MIEYLNWLSYREAVEFYSPGSPRSGAPWVLDGNQIPEPQRGSTIEQGRKIVEPRWGSENPVAVAPRVRYATLGYGMQRCWRKERNRRENSPTSYVYMLSLIVLASMSCTLPMARVLAQDAEEQAAELAAPDDPQMQLLKQYVRVNCAFARRVCKLSSDQEQQLAKMNDEWVAAEIKQATNAPVEAPGLRVPRMLGLARQLPAPQPFQPHSICTLVQKVFDTKIESTLENAQLVEYRREREERDKFRQEAIAGIVVSLLDKRMFLSEDQLIALQKSIARGLDKDLYWSIYVLNENYIPQIPDVAFDNILDKDQIASLAGWQKSNIDAAQIQLQQFGRREPVIIEK